VHFRIFLNPRIPETTTLTHGRDGFLEALDRVT
jgi:hypothetical protein